MFHNPLFWNTVVTGLVAPVVLLCLKLFFESKGKKLDDLVDKVNETSDKIDHLDQKMNTQGVATRNIVRYRLLKNMGHAIHRGYTTSKELQEMCNLYDSYKELNGNGVVDKMYKDFTALTIDDKRGS